MMIGLIATAMLALATGPQAPDPADQAAIREVVKRYLDPIYAKDREALEALFTEDADQLGEDGSFRRGRDALVTQIVQTARKNRPRRTITPRAIKLVAPDVAMLDGNYRIAADEPVELWASITLLRGEEGWQIAAIRILRPIEPTK
jgi:uncharacterized protein (TIGR02246 family)